MTLHSPAGAHDQCRVQRTMLLWRMGRKGGGERGHYRSTQCSHNSTRCSLLPPSVGVITEAYSQTGKTKKNPVGPTNTKCWERARQQS